MRARETIESLDSTLSVPPIHTDIVLGTFISKDDPMPKAGQQTLHTKPLKSPNCSNTQLAAMYDVTLRTQNVFM